MQAPAAWRAPTADGPVRGQVTVPGSKSITNRALVLAALADGPAAITGGLVARDTTLMRDGLAAMGASVDGWTVGPGPARAATVDCGLAGTVARFLPPVAALRGEPVLFDGDARMRARPLGPLLTALRTLGGRVEGDALPVRVRGPLAGSVVTVDASTSSQLLSGLLLVGASLPAGLDVRHVGGPLVSLPHVRMTVAMLREQGAVVHEAPDRWVVEPGPLRALDRTIEPDLSNAAPFLAAAAATGGAVTVAGWPAQTTQPGALLPGLLEQMGAACTYPVDGLTVVGGRLRGIDVDLRDASELALTLAALAVLADSPSRLRGIGHVRGHETDRLAAAAEQLGRLGARVAVTDDGLAIDPAPLHGAELDPLGDHRLATAYAVVGLLVPGVTVLDVATTAKTLPDFPAMWAALVA